MQRSSPWCAVLAAAFWLGGPAAASAQADYIDTPGLDGRPGAERVPALLAAYNSGDPEQVVAAVAEHFTGDFAEIPDELHAEVWLDRLGRTGELSLLGLRSYDPPRDDLVVILQSELTGAWQAFVLGVEAGPPHRFLGVEFAPARRPSFLEPVAPLEGDALVAAIDGLLDRLVAADQFSGSVVVSLGGEVVYSRAAGLADRRHAVPNRLDTRFNLGSMNKMFTAVATARLVQQGKLDWDDTVGEHLPDWPNARVRDTVQVRHLLSHTSGLGSHFTDEFMDASKARYRDLADYLPLFAEDDPAFEPGTDWAYSNAGFYVLGRMLEQASGKSYYDLVRDEVYAPAGMTRSDSYDVDIPIEGLASGYTRERMGWAPGADGERWLGEAGWRDNMLMHSVKGGPAGGGFSTAPDLIAFGRALVDGTLVTPETLELLTSPKPELSSPGYGYGFGVRPDPRGGRIVGHGGGFPGINANLDVFLDSGDAVAVMANMDDAASLVADRIREWLTGS